MSSSNSAHGIDRRQAALDRAALERWQRQRNARAVVMAYLASLSSWRDRAAALNEQRRVEHLAAQLGVVLA